MIAEHRIDIAASVAEVMATSTRLPAARAVAVRGGARACSLELRAERRQPWINIEMPLRRVTE